MKQLALIIGAVIYLVLGSLHGGLALRDVGQPRTFTPTDDSVRKAMEGVPIALHPSTDLWKAWLGFNLSHSLGLVVFGGGLLAVTVLDLELFTNSVALQVIAIGMSGVYLTLSVKFWFSGPIIGSGLATLCLIGASLFS